MLRSGPARRGALLCQRTPNIGLDTILQVLVRDNNVDQALRFLKKKMQREGIFREMRQRKAYEKPSERKAREKAEAVRRSRKAARKQAIREGLIAAPKPKPRFAGPRRPVSVPNTGTRTVATEPKVSQDQQ
jgi:small subunit ribosomal protein S21